MKNEKKFSLVLVKPSHYDDDGYVIQWFRSSMPANSLACLYGLAVECDKEQVLGKNVELRNFGTWSVQTQKAKLSRNPKTGEKLETPEKRKIRFKMSKKLFKKINNNE